VRTVRLTLREFKYQQISYWRSPVGAFFTFFLPLMFLVIFASTLKNSSGEEGLPFDQFFVPAILTFGIISASYTNLAINLATQREEGLLKRFRGTPLPPSLYMSGLILNSLMVCVILVAITLSFGAAFYNVHIPDHVGAIVLTDLVGAFTFCSLGIAVTVIIPNAEAAPAVVNGIYLPLLFISGTFFQVSGVLAKVAAWFPVRPFILASVRSVDPRVSGGYSGKWLGEMAIWGVVGLLIAARRFRWVPLRKA
jgi:ABC-2 type transport system permease protein